MTSIDLLHPARLIPGTLALVYGQFLILALPQSWNWLIGITIIVLAAAWFASYLDYHLLALWPAFIGLFLLCASIGALIAGLPLYAMLPLTHSNLELWVAAAIACGFIGWGMRLHRNLTVD
jgi:hypothetical protein